MLVVGLLCILGTLVVLFYAWLIWCWICYCDWCMVLDCCCDWCFDCFMVVELVWFWVFGRFLVCGVDWD